MAEKSLVCDLPFGLGLRLRLSAPILFLLAFPCLAPCFAGCNMQYPVPDSYLLVAATHTSSAGSFWHSCTLVPQPSSSMLHKVLAGRPNTVGFTPSGRQGRPADIPIWQNCAPGQIIGQGVGRPLSTVKGMFYLFCYFMFAFRCTPRKLPREWRIFMMTSKIYNA